jgi:DNA-binding winged helix-turn-helix (wHTH) protein
MPDTEPAASSLVFDEFELRLDTYELFRSGLPVKLQQQPARVLAVLALQAGTAVSRQDIRRAAWGEETHLDFDLALNYGIRQIRRALGDSTEQPRFIETLPRVGYRFIAPVEVRRREPEAVASTPEPSTPPAASRRAWDSSQPFLFATALVLLLAIVGLIALRFRGAEPSSRSPASPNPPTTSEGMRAYLEGQYFSDRSEHEKALQAFEKATLLEPEYAPGWAALGHELLQRQHPAREIEPLLEPAEREALKLDPGLCLAHLNRAVRLFQYDYDWQGAEQEFLRAVALDPQMPETHYEYATLLAARGRHVEALEQINRALYLRPEPQLVRSRAPWFYYLARRYDEAILEAQHQIALAPGTTSETNRTQPELFWAFRTITLAALAKGDRNLALEGARGEAHWLGDPEPASLDGHWRFKESNFAKHGTPRPWFRVVPAIELGDRERALDLLFQMCRERSDSMIPFLRVDPIYDGLRDLPKFRALLSCANLADAPG